MSQKPFAFINHTIYKPDLQHKFTLSLPLQRWWPDLGNFWVTLWSPEVTINKGQSLDGLEMPLVPEHQSSHSSAPLNSSHSPPPLFVWKTSWPQQVPRIPHRNPILLVSKPKCSGTRWKDLRWCLLTVHAMWSTCELWHLKNMELFMPIICFLTPTPLQVIFLLFLNTTSPPPSTTQVGQLSNHLPNLSLTVTTSSRAARLE